MLRHVARLIQYRPQAVRRLPGGRGKFAAIIAPAAVFALLLAGNWLPVDTPSSPTQHLGTLGHISNIQHIGDLQHISRLGNIVVPDKEQPAAKVTPTPKTGAGKLKATRRANELDRSHWRELTQQVADEYGLGDMFVRQIDQESGFNPDVIFGARLSSKGAAGIAQIMPNYHPHVHVFDPDDSLRWAARTMAAYLDHYNGSPEKALAAYNAGSARIDDAIAKDPDNWSAYIPQETLEYIAAIGYPAWPSETPSPTPEQTAEPTTIITITTITTYYDEPAPTEPAPSDAAVQQDTATPSPTPDPEPTPTPTPSPSTSPAP